MVPSVVPLVVPLMVPLMVAGVAAIGMAKAELEAADAPPGSAAARLAKGFLAELEANHDGAAAYYEEALRLGEQRGEIITPGSIKDYADNLAAIRALVDEDEFKRLWAEGRQMNMDEAIALALKDGNE